MKNEHRKRIVAGIVVFFIYFVIYIVGKTFFQDTYTYEWTIRHIIFLFAIISITYSVFNKYITALVSAAGYIIGILLGEVIGNPLYLAEVARYEEMAQQADYIQKNMPHHFGWLICIISYIIALVIGMVIQQIYTKKHNNT